MTRRAPMSRTISGRQSASCSAAPPIDIQAALTAIGRRAVIGSGVPDLNNTHIQRADLTQANLSDAILTRALMTGIQLQGANLRNADLREADLHFADLRGADLQDA